ncbi:MAG: UbiD family decarboxylase [Gammaproteobacteria bacterium]|nr:UbiD family decarboxylase [Gammaproteobacteria bacterium]
MASASIFPENTDPMEFRELIASLEQSGDLLRIKAAVDPEYELGALLQQAEARGKACWFEEVRGSGFAAIGGLMTSPARHALAVGRSVDDFFPVHKFAALLEASRQAPLAPQVVDHGPVSEVVLTGAEIDLTALPVPRFFSGDSHRFITAGLGVAMDPDSGIQNLGFYRQPVIGKNLFSLGASNNSNLMRIYKEAKARGAKLPVAVVIGGPPALLIAAGSRMPPEVSDLGVAGALSGEPISLVKCQSSELMVPAEAEFVIEAEVDFSAEVAHTMGEYGDQFGATTSPVAKVLAITHRRSAVFHIIMGGMNREHNALGVFIFSELRNELLAHLQEKYPFVVDLNVDFTPRRGGLRAQLAVAIDKQSEDQPNLVIDEIFGFFLGPFPMRGVLQRVVVVDQDVNIWNSDDIEWAISSRMDKSAKMTVYDGQSPDGYAVGRFGIDATVSAEYKEAHERPVIPSREKFSLDKYL